MKKQKMDRRRGRNKAKKGTAPSQPDSSRRPFEFTIDLTEPVRLNRYIARSGVCSRRDADDMIKRGLVKLNGEVVSEMGVKVKDGDEVVVNGKHIVPTDKQYVLLNKPTDTITTTSDEKGRKSVMDLLGPYEFQSKGVFPVGRLDRHTTGVLLLTNDGMLAHRLTHPSYEINKEYLVQTRDVLSDHQIEKLLAGVELEDGAAKVDKVVRADDGTGLNLILSKHEGRNRQVRRMIEIIGSEVIKLDRVRYAGLTAKGVRKGKWRRLSRAEVTTLYRKVKL